MNVNVEKHFPIFGYTSRNGQGKYPLSLH